MYNVEGKWLEGNVAADARELSSGAYSVTVIYKEGTEKKSVGLIFNKPREGQNGRDWTKLGSKIKKGDRIFGVISDPTPAGNEGQFLNAYPRQIKWIPKEKAAS